MKKLNKTKSAGVAAMGLIASLALSQSANAQVLTLKYEDTTSGHAIGEAYNGPFKINLQNFDMGAVYPQLGTVGSAAGFGQNGTAGTESAGVTALNSLQSAGATGAQPGEDSWGIARVLTITDNNNSVVWSEAATNQQLTIMFYGEQDFYVNQLANGFQEIDGTGMHIDLYLQNKSDASFTNYDPTHGSSWRTGASSYQTVTDGAKILSTVAVGGFIHDAGVLGGLDTAFASNFNASSGGHGQAFLDVVGGTQASQFDTNSIASDFVKGLNADLFAQFTTTVNSNPSTDWLVTSNDPVVGAFSAVPEPSTYGLIGAGVLAGVIALRRRRQNRA